MNVLFSKAGCKRDKIGFTTKCAHFEELELSYLLIEKKEGFPLGQPNGAKPDFLPQGASGEAWLKS